MDDRHVCRTARPVARRPKADWTHSLLKAVGNLNDVAGNHARSYFEMAPAGIVVRLTQSLVAGYETYGFKKPKDREAYSFPEVIDGILHDPPDYVGIMALEWFQWNHVRAGRGQVFKSQFWRCGWISVPSRQRNVVESFA